MSVPDKTVAHRVGAESNTATVDSGNEVIAAALNEQGFLLQHKVLETIEQPDPGGIYPHKWYVEAVEVPVSLPSGVETRIDVLLGYGTTRRSPWRAVLECKRSAREYKRWIFFDSSNRLRGVSAPCYFVELADLAGVWNHQDEPAMSHRIERQDADAKCPLFNFYVEARVNKPGSGRRASATEAIEDAFRQVVLGQVGLARRLRATHELKFRLVPVVVTTAEMFAVKFEPDRVSLASGKVAPTDLTLEARPWLAVNYRVDDTISEESRLTTNRSVDIATDLISRQIRTVFVTQADHVQDFLAWLGDYFQCDG